MNKVDLGVVCNVALQAVRIAKQRPGLNRRAEAVGVLAFEDQDAGAGLEEAAEAGDRAPVGSVLGLVESHRARDGVALVGVEVNVPANGRSVTDDRAAVDIGVGIGILSGWARKHQRSVTDFCEVAVAAHEPGYCQGLVRVDQERAIADEREAPPGRKCIGGAQCAALENYISPVPEFGVGRDPQGPAFDQRAARVGVRARQFELAGATLDEFAGSGDSPAPGQRMEGDVDAAFAGHHEFAVDRSGCGSAVGRAHAAAGLHGDAAASRPEFGVGPDQQPPAADDRAARIGVGAGQREIAAAALDECAGSRYGPAPNERIEGDVDAAVSGGEVEGAADRRARGGVFGRAHFALGAGDLDGDARRAEIAVVGEPQNAAVDGRPSRKGVGPGQNQLIAAGLGEGPRPGNHAGESSRGARACLIEDEGGIVDNIAAKTVGVALQHARVDRGAAGIGVRSRQDGRACAVLDEGPAAAGAREPGLVGDRVADGLRLPRAGSEREGAVARKEETGAVALPGLEACAACGRVSGNVEGASERQGAALLHEDGAAHSCTAPAFIRRAICAAAAGAKAPYATGRAFSGPAAAAAKTSGLSIAIAKSAAAAAAAERTGLGLVRVNASSISTSSAAGGSP